MSERYKRMKETRCHDGSSQIRKISGKRGRNRSVEPREIRRHPRKLFFKFLWMAHYFRRGYFCFCRLFSFRRCERTNIPDIFPADFVLEDEGSLPSFLLSISTNRSLFSGHKIIVWNSHFLTKVERKQLRSLLI